MWMMNYNIFTLETLAALLTAEPQGGWPHNFLILYGDEPEQISLITKEPATIGPGGISKHLRSGTGQVSSRLSA